MPAGNDASAALAELADQFGQGVGRAETLIAASRERFAGVLATAQLKPIDYEATAEMKEDGFGGVAKSAGLDEEEVLDACVAGQYVRYVAIDANGRTFKGAFLADDVGKAPKTVDKNVDEAEEAAEEAAAPPEAQGTETDTDTGKGKGKKK